MSWPHHDNFMKCPLCKRSTWLGSRERKEILSLSEANEILLESYAAERAVPADELESWPVLEDDFRPVYSSPQADAFD